MRSLSHRNQSTDLLCESMDWFLYKIDHRHDRFETLFIQIHRGFVLTTCKALFALFLIFFFYLVFFHEYPRFTGQQVKGETISLYPFYHLHPLYRHLDISCIAAESSPVRIAGRRKRTWNLWYTLFRIHCFCTCTGNCCC